MTAPMYSPGIRFTIILAYLAAFWIALPWLLWQAGVGFDARFSLSLAPWAGGWIVAGSGATLMAMGIVALRLRGRGLPVSALPPPRLVVSGPYRWVRHPVYLGFNLVIVGVGLSIGSVGLALAVGLGLLLCWLLYAWVEERGLVRRFGEEYRSYQRQVGMLPRLDIYRAVQLLARTVLPVRVEGRAHVPRSGGAVLVANHACYADPVFLQCVTWRRIHFLATAEVFRAAASRWVMRRASAVPVRRYRVDPAAYRELLRRTRQGELVGVFVEGERSPLGAYQGALPHVARMLRHMQVPVIPVGISGNYDVGPRWAGRLRVRRVGVRIGAPLVWDDGHARPVIDRAIAALLDDDPQRVHLAGLERARLRRVLWRCPACLDEAAWQADALACRACGAQWRATAQGRFQASGGETTEVTLAELARPVWQAPEAEALEAEASGAAERSVFGPIEPLVPLGEARLIVTPRTVSFGDLSIALSAVRTASTERADTLQLATATTMWQFRLRQGSVFRLQCAIERWRAWGHSNGSGPPRATERGRDRDEPSGAERSTPIAERS